MTAYELARISRCHFQATTNSNEQREAQTRYEEAKAHQLAALSLIGKALASDHTTAVKLVTK